MQANLATIKKNRFKDVVTRSRRLENGALGGGGGGATGERPLSKEKEGSQRGRELEKKLLLGIWGAGLAAS